MRAHAFMVVLVAACGDGSGGDGEETSSGSTGATSVSGSTSSASSGGSTADDETGSSEGGSGSDSGSGSGSGGESGAETTGSSARVPADVLDLGPWKLTLPIADPRDADTPWEILQPELATFSIDPYFLVAASGDAVIFHAHAGGTTTDNSGYPRSELREMTADGAELASWSTSDGTHTMTIVQAITQLPEVKPHVVAGQVHDAEDDVVMIRLEGEHLFVEGGGDELGTLDDAYTLGTVFTVVVAAHDGMIDVFYEDLATPAVSVPRDVDGCYFKAGAYTQSNEEQGDAPDAYGEVVLRELVVDHSP
jgi:hypothetical protein